jgi:hypothetical protein
MDGLTCGGRSGEHRTQGPSATGKGWLPGGVAVMEGSSGMGMFKRMKDMKDMIEAAPGMVAQAQQLGAQAQQMAVAQQAAMQAQFGQAGGAQPGTAPAGAAGTDFEPIAGVTLEQFVSVSRGVAAYGYDASKLADVAASQGIDSFTWDTAQRGWNERIHRNRAVAQRFNQIYRGL